MKQICFLLIVLFSSLSAKAIECNCSRKIGSCSATVRLKQNTLIFQSNTNQCAQVVYDVNGEPSSITLTYGEGSTEYLGRDPQIQYPPSVRSCDICETNDQQQQQQQSQSQQPPQRKGPTLEQGLAKLNEWVAYCHNAQPSCNENDRAVVGGPNDNFGCLSLLKSCLNDCAGIGNAWKVPGNMIQQICPPFMPPFAH